MKRPVLCLCIRCDRVRPHEALGYCNSCYRHHHPGAAPRVDGPTGVGPGAPGIARTAADIAGRLEDYAFLLDLQVPRAERARRLGVSYRTTHRYDARLAQMEPAP